MGVTFDWTTVSTAWDARRSHVHEVNEPVVERLLQALDLRDGDRVLELASGTGELAVRMAELVGAQGHVFASDAAEGMVALVRRIVDQRRVTNIDVARYEADDTGLPDASVDAIVCQMGLMFVADPAAALREWRRVLAPGGRVALAVWAAPQHNPWLANVGMSAMMHGVFAGGPPTAPGGVFSLAEPDALRRLASDAGFSEVSVQEVSAPARYGSADEHFDTVTALAGPLAAAIGAADDEARSTVRAAVAEADARFTTDEGLVLPGLALVVRAQGGEPTKP